MTLRLASLSIFALAALALTACKEATIANGNGGGGSTTTSTTHQGGGGSAPNACVSAGGTCVAIVPDACANGTWGDPTTCTTGVGVGCCLPAVDACTAAGGACVAIVPGACVNGTWSSNSDCGTGLGVGCCLPKQGCGDTCETVGATRCIDNIVETCDYNPETDCLPVWMKAKACPQSQTCNATATACVSSENGACSFDSDCGCGCFCDTGGLCACAGTSWFGGTCSAEEDCGPACVGASCLGGLVGTCLKACTPGLDQTCNGNPSQSSLAGHCNADFTCTCNNGFSKQDNGLCQ